VQDRKLYSIKEARELLGGISRNGIYALLRTGELPQERLTRTARSISYVWDEFHHALCPIPGCNGYDHP
jgi:predicted DNA-binding transcriptional regulator AlpA